VKLTLEDYNNPQVDPNRSYRPESMIGSESMEAMLLDPALLVGTAGISPNALRYEMTSMLMHDIGRMQQHIVFDLAKNVGILQPFVATTRDALQFVDFSLDRIVPNAIAQAMLSTGIGIATQTLSAVPNIYVQIANLALGFVMKLVSWGAGLEPLNQPVRELLRTQEYSEDVDSDVFNLQVRTLMRTSNDWSSIFAPRYRGQLTSVFRASETGQRSQGWALGDGTVTKILWPRTCPSGSQYAGKKKCWDWSDGQFLPTGGLGMIPGGERIYGIVQTTSLEPANGPKTGHPAMYGTRCGGAEKVSRLDLGSFYPTTTQGALSIWELIFQIGPAMYTVDAIGLAEGREKGNWDYEIYGWKRYLNEIWEGVIRLWRNAEWEHNWGCGYWKGALMNLVQNYTYSPYGVGVMSWTPNTNDALSLFDQEKWEESNVYEQLMKEALWKLTSSQLLYLGKSNIAAYLPIYGGVEAHPLQQEKKMGAMREYVIQRAFVEARRRILEGDSKYNVVLKDVVDPTFRKQIKDAGGGKESGQDMVTLQLTDLSGVAIPTGGLGIDPGIRVTPKQPKRTWPYLAAGGGALAATAAGYYFWDDLARLLTKARNKVRQRLPRRLR